MKENDIKNIVDNINDYHLLFDLTDFKSDNEITLRKFFIQDFCTKQLDECVELLKNNYPQDPNNVDLNLVLLQIYIYQLDQVLSFQSKQYNKDQMKALKNAYNNIIDQSSDGFLHNFPIDEDQQKDKPFLFTSFTFNDNSGSSYDFNSLELKQKYTNKINELIDKCESNNALINIDSNPLFKTLISWIKLKITIMNISEISNQVDNCCYIRLKKESFDTEKLSNAIKIIYSSFKDYLTNFKLIQLNLDKDLFVNTSNAFIDKKNVEKLKKVILTMISDLQDSLESIKKNEELRAEEERIKLEKERITLEKKEKNEKKKEKKKQLKAKKKEDANLVKVENNEEQKKEEKDAILVKEEEEEKQTDNEQINSQDDQINSQSEQIDSDDQNITIQQEVENMIENLKSLTESIKNNFADEIDQEKDLCGYNWNNINKNQVFKDEEHNCYFIATNKLLKALEGKGYEEKEEFLNLWRTKHTDFNYVKNINSFKFKLYGKQGDYRCVATKIIKDTNSKAKIYLFEEMKTHEQFKNLKAKNITEIKLDNKTFINITKRFEQKDSNNNNDHKINDEKLYQPTDKKAIKSNEYFEEIKLMATNLEDQYSDVTTSEIPEIFNKN